MDTLLELRDLGFAWPGQAELLDIPQFSLGRGETLFLKGPSGSGKTTLLGLLGGVQRAARGQVQLLGTELGSLSAGRRDHFRVDHTGYIFQQFNLLPFLSVRENVRIGVESALGLRQHFWLGRTDAARVREGIDEVVTLTGLAAKIDRPVGELSHGDQRAAEIAMALTLKPRLLLLDEPTAGMGEHETYQVAGLIRRLHRNSAYTIVLIEHDMRVVFNLADSITVLAEGSTLADGTPAEIAENPVVQAAYLGHAE